MRFCSLKVLRSSFRQGNSFQSIIVLFIRALAIYTATAPAARLSLFIPFPRAYVSISQALP